MTIMHMIHLLFPYKQTYAYLNTIYYFGVEEE